MLEVFLQFLASQVLYLALHLESGSFPRPLTPRQEVEAFAALRRGDADARDTIIRHNLRLVAHIVKKYCALPGDAEDLISIGTIGLIKAVSSFDSTKQVRFSTYARLVAHIVKKYCALPGDAEDLISIGTIGLIKAVSSFDSTKQVRFSTYASRCIENAMLT